MGSLNITISRLIMPNKYPKKKGWHVPKQKHKVTNWSEYNASLRRRGDITVWLSEDAISQWYVEDRVYDGTGAPLGVVQKNLQKVGFQVQTNNVRRIKLKWYKYFHYTKSGTGAADFQKYCFKCFSMASTINAKSILPLLFLKLYLPVKAM